MPEVNGLGLACGGVGDGRPWAEVALGDVRVLDGGFQAWVAAGLPQTTEVPSYPPGRLTLRDRWTGVIDRDGLRERLGTVRLLDARAAGR